MPNRIVVIGGGLAAGTAVAKLRERGYEGAIDLVTSEAHRPYERPPLSKGYLTGSEERDSVFVHAEGWEAAHDVALHVGNPATRISPDHGTVELADGTTLAFDRLLIATGAQPRRLDVPGADAAGVRTFRTLDDAERLRGELAPGDRRVVLVGAGWIGLELAAAARGFGNDVVVVTPDRVPLANALGERMGRVFLDLHEEHGVDFRLEERVTAVETGDGGAVTGVRTESGVIPADLVVVGVGAAPDTALAEAAGLAVDGGILVDARLATSDPSVYAAGDVANPLHPVLGERLRSEHWQNAISSGEVAAANLVGGDAQHDEIPYFFTDQYDLGMEYSGYAPLAVDADVVIRGDLGSREFIAFWVADGRVVAGMNVNVWDVNDQVQRLIRDEVAVDADRLSDPAAELASLT
ncbi:MAG: NAD(P)/FAD-dependent oxidoreductase [Microbacterium sp.]